MRSVLKNKVLVSIIGILLLANIAMLVFFITGMKKPEKENSQGNRSGHSTVSFLQNKIGFTTQQINQFNELKEEHRLKLNPLFEDLRITKDDFFLLVKDSLTDFRVDSVASLIGEKQKTLDIQVFGTVRDIRKLCTPQQQLKFDSLLPKIAYKIIGHIRRGNPQQDSLKRTN